MGILDLKRTVYSLCEEHPQLVGILQGLGFESIGNPIMMRTAARIMTIPKAAEMRGLPMVTVITALQEAGFIVEGGE